MWTGTISSTNGWEFTLRNLFDFRRRQVAPVVFCEKTRQLFVGFSDKQDDAFYQWDLDSGRCVYAFHAGKGFRQYPEAVSPDGRYLIVTRYTSQVTNWETFIVSVEKRSVVAKLGYLGAVFEVRFSPDGTKIWLRCGASNGPAVFTLTGAVVKEFSENDFLRLTDSQLWHVPVSKFQNEKPGLYFKDSSGITHLLATDYSSHNYWITKDRKIIVTSNRQDEIVIWDAESARELARQRITKDRMGGGRVIYDEVKDRFLITDVSYQGTTYLRTLTVTKRPSANSQLTN